MSSEIKSPLSDRPDWPVERWVRAVDPLRGIAALAVVIHHSRQHVFASTSWLGSWGVILFFVLSGFCIHLPQAAKADGVASYDLHVDWSRFFSRRARRLLPTHYAALILSAVVGCYATTELISRPTLKSLVAHLFLVHTWYNPYYSSINAVFWSIAIEVHFYLAYPVYLQLRKYLGTALPAALLCGALGLYFASSVCLSGGWRWVGQHFFLTYWWQWALGAYLADVYVAGRLRSWMFAITFPGAPLFWALCSLAIGFVDPVYSRLHVVYWIAPVICFLLVASILVHPRWPAMPRLAYIGGFSYSIYLVHPVAMALAIKVMGNFAGPLAVLGFTIWSIIFSWIFFMLVERHFLSHGQMKHFVHISP